MKNTASRRISGQESSVITKSKDWEKVVRVCRICQNEFKPSSRSLVCYRCIGKNKKVDCPTCDGKKKRCAKSCMTCYGKVQGGINNHNWRGGRSKHSKGYIYLHNPNHPKSSNGYVFEHRLVMEKHLGRYLEKDEIVHHKNGIKDDNRLENLDLMTISEHAKHHARMRREK